MAPVYALSLSKYNGPDNGVVWLPGSLGFVLRVYCSGSTLFDDPFKDIGVTCTTITKDSAGHLISRYERWYSLESNFTSTKHEKDGSSSLVLALLADLKDVGNVRINFSIKKKLANGTFQLMGGSELDVDRAIRTMDLDQVKKETEAELNK
ncbi:hypothetical protein RJZ56_001321 [Blastomyces dermatitidis]|uniref:Uncharacterized protein n=3 Tax=Blastomyces TaxID=229219 RepID=A0A179U7U4_BLAGS|nr:uncharacterized protein BDBG_00118 [Blastomyces gilchristii SLH14081]XP_031575608.1 hypothetical protein, variant 1 [Blastomyces gilchristii SLH14081]XP_031575609.1 hypothetical protein, variant 2 [Blastomyces gilchristii SLH14081]XP_031575610.1 hypothetical protein, variant 3 [Blastomyces gilchristii SLH14081]XP_031575611.1 hypothetical protein, variant 4 [Blastomyces gilchristii SLH14081]XP_031575612.1 hypothetical protein, variant 5 [Blastomyces gilchristii SLH14081]XP_045273074.1 uncha